MKTNTYLRWSLLIPFIVWMLCLLGFLIAQASPAEDLIFNQSIAVMDYLVILAAFYLFGIIVWLMPYLLLSLILFLSSFIAPAQVMIRIFALSPLAMTALTLALMNILLFFDFGEGTASSLPVSSLQEFATSSLAMGGISLLWGYICVGIGYGIYKLLRRRGMIRDEQVLEPAPQPL